jgi:hypothetical protein
MDLGRPFILPGAPVEVLVGVADQDRRLVAGTSVEIRVKDQEGAVVRREAVASANADGTVPALSVTSFPAPSAPGAYALEALAPDDEEVDPVEDYFLVTTPQEARS